ncbi:MAG: hypothetical protein JNL85_16690 [Rubrivivax sp.]|nr:hypothetical protein [Rubrivivax sp.]
MRTLLLLLLLANALVFSWASGWLDPMLPAPGQAEREPARLEAQVNPGAVKVLAPAAASEANDARLAAARCVEVGPFGLVDASAAESVLESAGLAAGTWERDLRGPAQVWLRVPRADAAMRDKLQALAAGSTLLAGGFRSCASAP